ncbi:MAG: hypothetical protein H7Z43_15170 [Clostridia bacterium]|nr:hypothetical protein [Deltaproteobacteria bacterium]
MQNKALGLLAVFGLLFFVACGNDDPRSSDIDDDEDPITVTYTLTLTPSANGSVVADTAGPYVSGTVVTLTATPVAGYKIGAWTGTNDDTSTSPVNRVTMVTAKTVAVSFVPVSAATFQLTLTQNVNGTISASPAGPTYSDGTTVILTATPAAGYRVASWNGTDNDASKSNTNTVTMTAAKTVSATFEVTTVQYTLVVTQSEFGGGDWGFTATPPGATYTATTTTLTYDADTSVTLQGVSTPTWPFDGWNGDVPADDKSKCKIIILMDANKNIKAVIPNETREPACTGA